MRIILGAGIMVTVLAAPGWAQAIGGQVGAGAAVNVPSVGNTVGAVTRGVGNTLQAVTTGLPTVDVRAGVSTRVARRSRCHDAADDSYYAPVRRDGRYYCEQPASGLGVDAGANAAVNAPR